MGDMPSHESLTRYTGFLLRKVSLATSSRFSATCGEHGLHPMHFGVLTVLEAEAPISQRALAQRTGIDPSTMVQRMDALESRGLVQRSRSAGDRRSYEITLTDKGRETLAELRQGAAEHTDSVFGVLDEREREQLHGLLVKLERHLDNVVSPDDPRGGC